MAVLLSFANVNYVASFSAQECIIIAINFRHVKSYLIGIIVLLSSIFIRESFGFAKDF